MILKLKNDDVINIRNNNLNILLLKTHLYEEYIKLHKNIEKVDHNLQKIVCIFKNEMIGYLDILINKEYNEIKDIFVIKEIYNHELVYSNMISYFKQHFNSNKDYIVNVEDKEKEHIFKKIKFCEVN